MIRLGTPDDVTQYECFDDDIAFRLHQAGCPPAWKSEDGTLWFKKNKRLEKAMAKIGLV